MVQVHAKVRVANVSGVRTKKHQQKCEHKRRLLAAAQAHEEEAAPAQTSEVEMMDASKMQKRELAKLAKKERRASKMIVE